MNTEERAAKAKENFLSGFNCCQSVVLAFSDVLGIDEKTLASLSSGFGAGMGRLREVCGCVSAMTMVAGCLCPAVEQTDEGALSPAPLDRRGANYALVQKLAAAYKAENGSIICRELLSLDKKAESPMPSARNVEYYKKRPCPELCACAARILAEELSTK